MQRKASETSNLDALTIGQRSTQLVQDTADSELYVSLAQMSLLPSQSLDQFGFSHFKQIPSF